MEEALYLKKELLEWISDTDAVRIVMNLMTPPVCSTCKKVPSVATCITCGRGCCEECQNHSIRRGLCECHLCHEKVCSGNKLNGPRCMSICGACKRAICAECSRNCSLCGHTRCQQCEEWETAPKDRNVNCSKCGSTNFCKNCLLDCTFCGRNLCIECMQEDEWNPQDYGTELWPPSMVTCPQCNDYKLD